MSPPPPRTPGTAPKAQSPERHAGIHMRAQKVHCRKPVRIRRKPAVYKAYRAGRECQSNAMVGSFVFRLFLHYFLKLTRIAASGKTDGVRFLIVEMTDQACGFTSYLSGLKRTGRRSILEAGIVYRLLNALGEIPYMNISLYFRRHKRPNPGAAGLIALIIACSASAEVIYLKSGGSIRGIVTGKEGGTVTIDVGFGETSVDTAAIDSIAGSSGEELLPAGRQRQSGVFDGGGSLPPPLKSCFESMRRLRTMRFRAVNRQAELDRLDGEIDSLEHVLSAGAEEYESLNKELGAGSRKSLEEEIHFIGEAHRFNASIVSCQKAIVEKKANQQKGNPLLLEYIDSLDRFDERFKEYKKTRGDSLLQEHLPVETGIENDLRECKAEFKTAQADATFIRGNHIVVPVVVNKRGTVLLLLDTGASTVTLSRAAASKLGIDCDTGNKVLVSLANGAIDTGYSVLLRSVAVGDFRADNVRAIVHDKAPGSGIEGLLGMSYLQRFALHIDPVNKKLVLRKIVTR